MACHLFGLKSLPEPVLTYQQLDINNKLQWNSNQNTKILIQENGFKKDVWNGGHFV